MYRVHSIVSDLYAQLTPENIDTVTVIFTNGTAILLTYGDKNNLLYLENWFKRWRVVFVYFEKRTKFADPAEYADNFEVTCCEISWSLFKDHIISKRQKKKLDTKYRNMH